MHICMALSDYDTIPACAAIQSLKDSRDQKDHYNIFLFTAGVYRSTALFGQRSDHKRQSSGTLRSGPGRKFLRGCGGLLCII